MYKAIDKRLSAAGVVDKRYAYSLTTEPIRFSFTVKLFINLGKVYIYFGFMKELSPSIEKLHLEKLPTSLNRIFFPFSLKK